MLTEKEQSICREQVFGSLRDFRDLLQLEVTDDDLLLVGERYGLGTAPKVLAQVKSAFAA